MKYTSIKSVLYGLSTLIGEENWNENYFMEWAVKGARKLNLVHTYSDKVCTMDVTEHSCTLPSDCHNIIMMAVYNAPTEEISNDRLLSDLLNYLPTNAAYKHMEGTSVQDRIIGVLSTSQFVPLKRSTSPFLLANTCTEVLASNTCSYEYIDNVDGTLYTSFKSGTVVLAYKSYASQNGECLIPDNEDVKEAIESYVLMRHFEGKSLSGDRTFLELRRMYTEKFQVLYMKCKSLNLPTLDQLENMSNMQNRLKPQSHQYDKFFTTLGNKESLNFSINGTY